MTEKEKDSLVEELTRVSGRRFDKLDERRGSYKPLTGIDELTQLATEFTQDENDLPRWQRIKKLVCSAVTKMNDADQKKRVELLFGLFPGAGYMTARGLHANLREELDGEKDKKTSYVANKKALRGLASAIRVVMLEDRKKKRHTQRQYVRRDKYHELFSEAIESGYRIIELVGLPGMGKSWLAEGLTRERLAGGRATRIRFMNDLLFIPDLQAVLGQYGIRAQVEDIVKNPEAYLAELLCGEQAPEFVILDDLINADAVYNLLPEETKPAIIVTSRVRSSMAGRKQATVFVEEMDYREATNLIKELVPGISETDCQFVIEAVHGYPLLINYACALLMRQPLPAEGFCSAIKDDVASLASKSKTDAGKSLTVILLHLIELIREESELAYEVLECLCFMDGHPSVQLHFMNIYMSVGREGSLAGLRYIQAFDTLDAFSLVEITLHEMNGKPELVMHGLVQEIVQSLLLSREGAVSSQAARVLEFCLAEVRAWEASANITPGKLEATLTDIWARRADRRNADKLSVSEQYTRFKDIRYYANLLREGLAIFHEAKKIHEYLIEHPGERFGTVGFLYSDPDIRLRRIDVPAVEDDEN